VGKDGLQGQKIPAQGNALGNHNRWVVGTPCFLKKSPNFSSVFLYIYDILVLL
jgi:hypothetical protein